MVEQIRSVLAGTPLFGGLSVDQLSKLGSVAVWKNYKKNEIVFSEGDACNGFYIVAEGTVKIYKLSQEGREKILHIFGEGEPFGEVPVFTGQPFPANAAVLTESRLVYFPRENFVSLISGDPSLSLGMLAVLSRRLKEFTVQIENLALKEVPARIAAYLLYLLDEQEKDELVTLKISKGQLASLIGTIPETLSRILARMTREGFIEVDGKEIRVLDREGLETLAEFGRG